MRLISSTFLAACVATLALGASAASAVIFTVDTVADTTDAAPGDGICADDAMACSLRAAIEEANALAGADTIDVPAGVYVSPGLPPMSEAATLTGAGVGATFIDGADAMWSLKVDAIDVLVSDLTLQNGRSGATVDPEAHLTLERVAIRHDGVDDTKLYSGVNVGSGTLVMRDSLVLGGLVGVRLGRVQWYERGRAYLTNVTISAPVFTGLNVENGNADVSHVTITGAGAYGIQTNSGSLRVRNSVIADSAEADCFKPYGIGDFGLGGNLDSDGTCLSASPAGNVVATDPQLAPLADHGGAVATHTFAPTSPLRDAVPYAACVDAFNQPLDLDARGVTRPQGDGCDIGAVESEDVCDDADGDAICDDNDLCWGQDEAGDSDDDRICDDADACPLDPADDADADGVCGDVDSCPATANANQADADGDTLGDACDDDDDDDGVADEDDLCAGTPDSELTDANACTGRQRIDRACGVASANSGTGSYLRCVVHESGAAYRDGLLTRRERAVIIWSAAKSRLRQTMGH